MISFNSTDSTEKLRSELKFRSEVTDQVEKVVLNALKYNNPKSCIESSIKIMNEVPGSKFHLPETKYMVKETIQTVFDFEVHYMCKKCEIYTGTPYKKAKISQIVRKECGATFGKKSDEFFIYIPIEQQLRLSIEKNFDSIIQFKCSERDENFVSDVRDGSIHKNIDLKFPDSFNLSLLVNTDGAQVFDSTKKSLWPLQIIQKILHPKIRYLTSNILLVGLIFVKGKPDPTHFFFPLIQEITRMHKQGFRIESMSKEIIFRPFITHCVCDLPAKAKCQGILQYNGEFACGYCLHPGISIEGKEASGKPNKKRKTIRYVRQSGAASLRTHNGTICSLKKLQKFPEKHIQGFYTISCFIGVPELNIIHGFAIDYMHCILIRTTHKLAGFWLDSKNFNEPFYINPNRKKILNGRLLSTSIRPSSIGSLDVWKKKSFSKQMNGEAFCYTT